MKKLKIGLLLGLFFLQFSCTKTEYVESNPQLVINVISEYLVPVQGANVTLYNTEDDLYLKVDPIITLQTDQTGQVFFEELKEQRYYFYAEKDGLDNTSDVAATKETIQSGQRFEVVVKIDTPINY
ncbi:hypothetical protein [uncultured Sunxiuqinia sp.]|uniref:hypothetical protein n=1 Tax=uncultured Sunxiuqinia sp. TaxID=1573825 RepID=UPI002AA7C995|nr:hypothetical protein [uncultured Sunxiuqinia sp.]